MVVLKPGIRNVSSSGPVTKILPKWSPIANRCLRFTEWKIANRTKLASIVIFDRRTLIRLATGLP